MILNYDLLEMGLQRGAKIENKCINIVRLRLWSLSIHCTFILCLKV